MILQMILDLVHEPTRSGGGAANANAVFTPQPVRIDFGLITNHVRVAIGIKTLGKENLAIARLAAAHKEDELMADSKLPDLWDAISHRTANGVVAFELYPLVNPLFYGLDNGLESL